MPTLDYQPPGASPLPRIHRARRAATISWLCAAVTALLGVLLHALADASGKQSHLENYAMGLVPVTLVGGIIGLTAVTGTTRMVLLGVLGSAANAVVFGVSVLRLLMLA